MHYAYTCVRIHFTGLPSADGTLFSRFWRDLLVIVVVLPLVRVSMWDLREAQ